MSTQHLVTPRYRDLSAADLQPWIDQFHRDGYLFLQDYLTPEFTAELKNDLDQVLADPTMSQTYAGRGSEPDTDAVLRRR